MRHYVSGDSVTSYWLPVGVYQNSGLSGYTVAEGSLPTNNTIVVGSEGPNFPVTWNPRYAYAVRRLFGSEAIF